MEKFANSNASPAVIANRKKEGQRLVVETRLVYTLKAQCENWNISSDLASALNKISKFEEFCSNVCRNFNGK